MKIQWVNLITMMLCSVVLSTLLLLFDVPYPGFIGGAICGVFFGMMNVNIFDFEEKK